MRIKHQHGLTLIEVLAVLVIVSIIAVLLVSILSSSTNNHQKQVTKNKELQDASYALKIITKDFRRAITYEQNNPTTGTLLHKDNVLIVYHLTDKSTLTRQRKGDGDTAMSEEVIATNIIDFPIEKDSNNIIVKLVDKNNVTFETKLTIRGETK
ncbi:type II secretion system protein J [Lysinibacillus sp. NPDC097195]|uniref:PulJ/GspJ family protein n=1 Tax=Lysinibacillus sp. NPDC097195 TaxID=3364141 RepID=UPI00381C497B